MASHNITLADDDADALFLLNKLVISMYPHSSVSMFSNAEDALAHILDKGADIVITNHGMGNMSGTDLIKAIRQKEIQIPIIMISGNPEVEKEALKSGATDFFEKSLSTKKLEAKIRDLLGD